MKLDYDLMRSILLTVEDKESHPPGMRIRDISRILERPLNEVLYHLDLLCEKELLKVTDYSSIYEKDYRIDRLTFSGHEYLNNIRDNTIWEKAKDQLSKVASSASIEILGQIASSILKKSLGID